MDFKLPFSFLVLPKFPSPHGARTHFYGEIQSGGVSLTKSELFTNRILMRTNKKDSVLRKQYSGEKVSAKPRLLSDFASGGGGVWGGILRLLHPFYFGEIRGGHALCVLYCTL